MKPLGKAEILLTGKVTSSIERVRSDPRISSLVKELDELCAKIEISRTQPGFNSFTKEMSTRIKAVRLKLRTLSSLIELNLRLEFESIIFDYE